MNSLMTDVVYSILLFFKKLIITPVTWEGSYECTLFAVFSPFNSYKPTYNEY